MLDFVTVGEASMDAFLSVSSGSQYQAQLRDYAAALLERRNTRPDWCIVGLEGDVPVARAALWAVPGQAPPTDLVLIDADWNEPDLARAHAVLAQAHELAATLGAGTLHHHVDNPPRQPQYQEDEDARVRLLEEAGYELLRDGARWHYATSSAHDPRPAPALTFRALAEVGEDTFVETIARTYEGTRDSWLGAPAASITSRPSVVSS
jgi:hypothetical protein